MKQNMITECTVNINKSYRKSAWAGTVPQEGQHISCRNNGSFSLGRIFDRHGISQEDKFLRQLLIFSLSDQTESQQIYRNDCSNSINSKAV